MLVPQTRTVVWKSFVRNNTRHLSLFIVLLVRTSDYGVGEYILRPRGVCRRPRFETDPDATGSNRFGNRKIEKWSERREKFIRDNIIVASVASERTRGDRNNLNWRFLFPLSSEFLVLISVQFFSNFPCSNLFFSQTFPIFSTHF